MPRSVDIYAATPRCRQSAMMRQLMMPFRRMLKKGFSPLSVYQIGVACALGRHAV